MPFHANGRLANPDRALLDMLAVADQVHRATEGAFDVTLQPLWILDDAYAKRGEWPSDEQSAPARALIGQGDVAFNPDEIAFARPGMAITLNSLTHGYAADRVARVLTERGVQHAFVDTGEMETLGHGARRPVESRDPAPAPSRPTARQSPVQGVHRDGRRLPILLVGGLCAQSHSRSAQRHLAGLVRQRFRHRPQRRSRRRFVDGGLRRRPGKAVDLLRRFEAEAYALTKEGSIWSTPGFPREELA